MGDLSEHFSRREFECKGHGHRGHRAHAVFVSAHLVQHLEKLRAIVGKPLRILSGHRCAWWNARVGGARASQHVRGTAADIPQGYATVAQAEQAGFVGIGIKAGSAVHVDLRDKPARWHY
jgi:uncharacterized protein YcbK (DUF882 family)